MKFLPTFGVICVVTLSSFAAHATMPLLDDLPSARADPACRAWADKQIYHEDVAVIWGVLDDGNYDPEVAVRRLADICIGKPKPEIVGIGSSVGYFRDYCHRHSRQGVCLIKNAKPRCVGDAALCKQICERGAWCP